MEKTSKKITVNQIVIFENVLPSELQQTTANFLDRLNLTALSLTCKTINKNLEKIKNNYTTKLEALINSVQTKDCTGNNTIKILLQCASLATNAQLDILIKTFFDIAKGKIDMDEDSFTGFFKELLDMTTNSSFRSLVLFLSINYLHINRKLYDKNMSLLIELRSFLFKQLQTTSLNFFVFHKINYFFNVLREISSCAELNSKNKLIVLQKIITWLFQTLVYSNRLFSSKQNALNIIDMAKNDFLAIIFRLAQKSSLYFAENIFDCSFCKLDLEKNHKHRISKTILAKIKNIKFHYAQLAYHQKAEHLLDNNSLHLFDKKFFDEITDISKPDNNNQDIVTELIKKWEKRLNQLSPQKPNCKIS